MSADNTGSQRRIVALAPLGLDDSVDWRSTVAAAAAVARRCGGTATAVLLGSGGNETEATAAAAGADAIWLVAHDGLPPRPGPTELAAAFSHLLSRADFAGVPLCVLPAGPYGEETAALLAARLDGTALGLCAAVEVTDAGVTATRATYSGRALTTLTGQGLCVAALRAPRATDAAPPNNRATVHRLALTGVLPVPPPIERRDSGLRTPNLEGAKIVVSGGRGMAGEEGFALLTELAAQLDGALGGSLPTVDAGWIPVFRQVGQSGKFVTPELYLAVGISGTPQHMAGIGSNSRIAAINSDPEADIFRFAEVGIVGDWKQVLPALLDRLNPQRA